MQHPVFHPPTSAGVGFKPEHLVDILRDAAPVGFFEVHAENYMGDGGAPHAALRRLRADYPIFVHGVGLSIGGEGALDLDHLARLKRVVDRYEPHIVSEHLAWSTHNTTYYNDLLPMPYTQLRLNIVVSHLHQLQDVLGRQVLLENPSTYVAFEHCEMDEITFIREAARQSGCGLLLDLNNVYVSANNHGFSPEKYLVDFPLQQVKEIHLAGHATEKDDSGNVIMIDSHDRAVCAKVWRLFEMVVTHTGPIPTLIEWDNYVPEWSVMKSEADAATKILHCNQQPRQHHGI